jgi:hypothetical protein
MFGVFYNFILAIKTMSENSNRSKNILFAVGALGLLIGAAVLFTWANSSDEEEGDADIRAELKAQQLDKVKKNGPILEPQYFLMLLNFVGTQSAARMSKEKKKLDAERRAFLKNKNESAYSESVMKMIQLREAT